MEEECKQKYYTHDLGARSFKKREVISDKQDFSYRSEKKSLVKENKKERKNKAETNIKKNIIKYKENEENKREERRTEDNINKRAKENETIKIRVHNINRIKRDYIKIEQLAKYSKSEGYNIIGIIET